LVFKLQTPLTASGAEFGPVCRAEDWPNSFDCSYIYYDGYTGQVPILSGRLVARAELIPEPSALLVLLIGLGFLIAWHVFATLR